MTFNQIADVALRAFVIALLICAFFPGRSRRWVRFGYGFAGAFIGGVAFTLWRH